MNTALWVSQIFLAGVFLYSGICKSTQSERWLVSHGQTGVEGIPFPLIRFIGISELFGVAGIILPWLLNTFPVLTIVAAGCFALVMLLAARIHFQRHEYGTSAMNLLFMLISVFVAWGRSQML
jgi:hypothetical protein